MFAFAAFQRLEMAQDQRRKGDQGAGEQREEVDRCAANELRPAPWLLTLAKGLGRG